MKNKISFSNRIFIAGASGMAGSAIKRKLIKSGYGQTERGGKLLLPSRKDLNLLDYGAVKNWFSQNRPEIVIIAAAKVGGILANSMQPADFLLENLKIQTNLIESAVKYNSKRLLFLGSSCIYPKFTNQPIQEESLMTSELEPTNQWYAISKIAGIKLCEALRIQKGFDAICLMPTNLYGPGDNYHYTNSHVLPALIRKFYEASINSFPYVNCWGDGSPLREFLHVDDLADAALFALENWDPSSNDAPKDSNGNPLIYLNVGTGKDITIKELANKICSEVNFNGEIKWDTNKPNGTPQKKLNINRLKKLGWQSKIELNEGIKSTINLFIEDYKNIN